MMRLCALDEIPDGATRAFTVATADGPLDLFVLRRGALIAAYENACPHLGTPLDWAPNHFLSEDGSHIVCATHGARFRLEDGHCYFGPCTGEALRTLPARLEDGAVVLAI